VWILAENPSMFIRHRAEHAGHAMHTTLVAEIAERGPQPAERETYPNGMRKTTYRDHDGNEIGFGGVPR
jgi:hypothetical protein